MRPSPELGSVHIRRDTESDLNPFAVLVVNSDSLGQYSLRTRRTVTVMGPNGDLWKSDMDMFCGFYDSVEIA